MGAHQDAVQTAVVFRVAVISAGLNGALNALVGMMVHGLFLLLLNYGLIMCPKRQFMHCFFCQNVICCKKDKLLFTKRGVIARSKATWQSPKVSGAV